MSRVRAPSLTPLFKTIQTKDLGEINEADDL